MTSSALAGLSVTFDPLRDKSYRLSRLGSPVVDFLAWMELGGTAGTTLNQYEGDLARACLMYPDVELADFDSSHMYHVARSFPPKGRPTRIAPYRKFFWWAVVIAELIDRNPCDKLPEFKSTPPKVVEVFTEVEIAALTSLPLIDGALMQILFDTGIRKEEARGLMLEHFHPDPAPGRIQVLGKGRKGRLIRASLAVSQRIADLTILEGLNRGDHLWYLTRKNRYATSTTRRTTISDSTFQHWYERCLADAGVRYRKPHTTRHTFATRYLQNGGAIDRLSRLLGHDSIKTTDDSYNHIDTPDLDAEFDLVFARLTEQPELEPPETP